MLSLGESQNVFQCTIRTATGDVALGLLRNHSCLDAAASSLDGASVVVWTTNPAEAAMALVELDGIARRLVLCPPGIGPDLLAYVMETAEASAVVSDQPRPEEAGAAAWIRCQRELQPAVRPARTRETEWVLLTSGTTGLPKLVAHNLAGLTDAIRVEAAPCMRRSMGCSSLVCSSLVCSSSVWSTFYDIRRYGGLQIFLRAALSGAPLVLPDSRETVADFLARAAACGITHISGTPSHWRAALMHPRANSISPRYVRLSGEIADQAILNNLRAAYPQAQVIHAFASTEAGVAFEVTDGLPGFPEHYVASLKGVEMKMEDGSMRLRSNRLATGYLNHDALPLRSADGFVDTGDLVELRDGRYFFMGRRDGVINIGGLKVHPEEVEAVINRYPGVFVSLVRTRRSPITGAVVTADVALRSGEKGGPELARELLGFCRSSLAGHKVPAVIKFVPLIAVSETGKLIRNG
jgi:acyl-coenzyme A synthetase/AMP-(fatty) acid ligase